MRSEHVTQSNGGVVQKSLIRKFPVLNFRATSGHQVLCMRSDVSKEMSRFQLPSSGRRPLLLKVPNDVLETERPKDVKLSFSIL